MRDGPSLYLRLGGYDVIAAVIDDLFARLREDPQFARFSVRSLDSHHRARQLLVDQVCALAGGPCIYIGRDMRTSHAGLGITEDEWDANLRHTAAALQKHGIAEPEKREFLALFTQYKGEIVETTGAPAHDIAAR
ncbi:MAG: group 1 truncated hemoglobin [Bryobacterales bacterium]|nr:group 1 truncated hemoglobin [Bryobacterales bacterium]